MKNILKQAENAERLLKLTSDTMLLLNRDGICMDIAVHNVNLWFMKEEKLLGKNLFQLIPPSTYYQVYPEFKKVLTQKVRSVHNYEMTLGHTTYYFKCIMYPYDGMVLCQYRDITERSQRKLELEKKNHELNEIQKAALIGNWQYDTQTRIFCYAGHTGIMCSEEVQHINMDNYLELILPEDRKSFTGWMKENLKGKMENSVDYRIFLQGNIFYIRLKAFARERQKDGNVTIEGYIQNITDIQKRRNDINLLTHAINNSTEDIYSAHEDGTLIFCNRCFKERHGIGNGQDITRMKIYDLPSYGRDETSWKEFANRVKRGETNHGYIVYHPLPKRPEVLAIEGNAYWVTSDKGEGTIWTFGRDVSTRIRHEQQIKQFNQILDKIIENRMDRKSMGFGAEITSKKEKNLGEILAQAQQHDVIKYGIIPELVGRLPVITPLNSLDREALERILTEPKNAITKQYTALMALDGVKLEFDHAAIEAIADKALEMEIGARGLRSILEKIMTDIMFRVPSDKSIKRVIITADCVKDGKPPVALRNDNSDSV